MLILALEADDQALNIIKQPKYFMFISNIITKKIYWLEVFLIHLGGGTMQSKLIWN